MLIFFKLLSVVSIFLLSAHVVGKCVLFLFKLAPRERFFSLFLSLVLGLTIIVSSYALICTTGNTIQFAILILIIVVCWSIKHQAAGGNQLVSEYVLTPRLDTSCLPQFIIFVISVFCLQYFLLYDSNSEYLKTPFQDYVYYSRLSLPLNHLGLETNSLEAIYPQFLTQQPYHYLEIWLNALLVRSTNLPSVWVFFISSSTILLTIACVGFAAIFAHFQLRSIWIVFLALIFLSVTGVKWSFLQGNNFISNGALLSSTLLCIHPKFAPIYIFTLLVGLLLLNRYYWAAGTALAILPLVFVSTTPIAGVGVVAIASSLVIMKQLSWRKALVMIAPITLAVIYIILFYILHAEPYQFPSTGRALALQSIIPRWNESKLIFNIAVGVFINYAIYFAAYVLLLLMLVIIQGQCKPLSKIPLIIWVWFVVSLTTAAFARAFGTHYLDSFQFFSNSMIPISAVMLALILASVLQYASQNSYILTVLILVSLVVVNFFSTGTGITRYSPEFLRNISQVAPQMGLRGAYVLADSDYENSYMLSSDSYTAGNYISNFKNDYAFISLSELDIADLANDARFKRDSAQAEQIIRKSSFYRFAKFQALKHRNLSLDSLKYKFVFENNIGFICVSKRAELPYILKPLVHTVYTDLLSGERFYLLDTQRNLGATTAY
ncbi:MAG: hypothetical protein EOP45_04665 [Sphingobacteriaceae bacterium]|nr:MAG: hypothetical protein EOP45_04665 [Sphingobacteriaceae bacterium]